MPEMDWDSFAAAHYRAHLILVDFDRAEPAHAAAAPRLIRRLMASLDAVGNFAVAVRDADLLVAVEEDRDAARLRMALGAVAGEPTDAWSSVAQARLDKTTARRIRGLFA